MENEKWLDLSRIISQQTNIRGTVRWEDGDFSFGQKRNLLSTEVLLQKGFTTQGKQGADPEYIEYLLKIDEEKEIVLSEGFDMLSVTYFQDTRFEYPSETHLRRFYFEDQLDAYIEWAKRVTYTAYEKNEFV